MQLLPADKSAIGQVNIKGDPSGFVLDSTNIQFPPRVLRDGKTASFKESNAASYEPFKVYSGSSARALSIEFQWVAGGNFTPVKIQDAINGVKSYFYTGYLGSGLEDYPAVIITSLYSYINERTSWRMTSLDITPGEELVLVDGDWYHLHTKMTMSLESATQLGRIGGGDSLLQAKNLEAAPKLGWY